MSLFQFRIVRLKHPHHMVLDLLHLESLNKAFHPLFVLLCIRHDDTCSGVDITCMSQSNHIGTHILIPLPRYPVRNLIILPINESVSCFALPVPIFFALCSRLNTRSPVCYDCTTICISSTCKDMYHYIPKKIFLVKIGSSLDQPVIPLQG